MTTGNDTAVASAQPEIGQEDNTAVASAQPEIEQEDNSGVASAQPEIDASPQPENDASAQPENDAEDDTSVDSAELEIERALRAGVFDGVNKLYQREGACCYDKCDLECTRSKVHCDMCGYMAHRKCAAFVESPDRKTRIRGCLGCLMHQELEVIGGIVKDVDAMQIEVMKTAQLPIIILNEIEYEKAVRKVVQAGDSANEDDDFDNNEEEENVEHESTANDTEEEASFDDDGEDEDDELDSDMYAEESDEERKYFHIFRAPHKLPYSTNTPPVL